MKFFIKKLCGKTKKSEEKEMLLKRRIVWDLMNEFFYLSPMFVVDKSKDNFLKAIPIILQESYSDKDKESCYKLTYADYKKIFNSMKEIEAFVEEIKKSFHSERIDCNIIDKLPSKISLEFFIKIEKEEM